MPEEWIIFVDLVQKALVGQNVTTGPSMYKFMEIVLNSDAKAEFTQQDNLVGSCTVGNFIMVMATMTVRIFPVMACQDLKRFIHWYLQRTKKMKVSTFTIRLIQLNNYIPLSARSCKTGGLSSV